MTRTLQIYLSRWFHDAFGKGFDSQLCLVICGAFAAGCIGAAIVKFLPLARRIGGLSIRHALMKLHARDIPIGKLVRQFRIALQGGKAWLERLNTSALQGEKECEWLAAAKCDPLPGAGEAPVHGKGKGRPIGFNDAGKRRYTVLGCIGRAANPQIPAWRGAKDAFDMKCQHPLTKQRYRTTVIWRSGFGPDLDRIDADTTFQRAAKPTPAPISQPWALAILSGKQR